MMQIGERILLDLWEMIERICFDADMEYLMDARGELAIKDSLSRCPTKRLMVPLKTKLQQISHYIAVFPQAGPRQDIFYAFSLENPVPRIKVAGMCRIRPDLRWCHSISNQN